MKLFHARCINISSSSSLFLPPSRSCRLHVSVPWYARWCWIDAGDFTVRANRIGYIPRLTLKPNFPASSCRAGTGALESKLECCCHTAAPTPSCFSPFFIFGHSDIVGYSCLRKQCCTNEEREEVGRNCNSSSSIGNSSSRRGEGGGAVVLFQSASLVKVCPVRKKWAFSSFSLLRREC